MRPVVDEAVGAAYLYTSDGNPPVVRTVSTTVNVDLTHDGDILGIEFLTWPLPEPKAPYVHVVPEHPFLPGIFGVNPNLCDECGYPRNDHGTEYDWKSEEARDSLLLPPVIPLRGKDA